MKAILSLLFIAPIAPGTVWAAQGGTPLSSGVTVNDIISRYLGSFGSGGSCAQLTTAGIPEITGLFCILNNIINYLLTIAGGIALIFVLVGGLQYMVSGGDEKAITSSKSTITYAVLGLAITLGAILILNTVLSILIK